MSASVTSTRLTFGLYEVDLESGELWKAGFRIKLQSQPFKVLAVLLENQGHVVTREELQERVWGRDTIVDFDHSLGTAINKIREALGDSAENPRFIETLARRGYRFIAPVGSLQTDPPHLQPAGQHISGEPPSNGLPSDNATSPDSVSAADHVPKHTGSHSGRTPSIARPFAWALSAVTVVAAAAVGFQLGTQRSRVEPPHIVQLTHNGHLAPSIPSMEDLAAVTTDGVTLFGATIDSGHSVLSAVSLSGGIVLPLNIPAEVASPALGDISPDGSRLLLRDHLSPESEQPLWVVPTLGGSALRVGSVLAHDASWMPDGQSILYANGNDLYTTQASGQQTAHYASLPGRAFWLRWEPGGHLLRFTIMDPLTHTLSLWQLKPTDRTPQRLLADFDKPASECCGVWTADGRAFVFQSSKGGNTDLWKLAGDSTTGPQRITDGPLQFESPVAARSGSRIFFMGADARSELEVLSPAGSLVPAEGFLSSAVRVDYSRDGHWVVWTDTDGKLWRARSDGTEKLQLTPDNLYAFLARWSPDGSRLAVMAREPGSAWRIYITNSGGGTFQPVLRESRNAADPSWSPDGQSLVFGRVNDFMGKENAERTLHIVKIKSGQITQVPDSDGLFSPRWSPDGRYLAALSLDQRQVKLYNFATKTWTRLAVSSGADPIWSQNSRYLFVHASLDPEQPIDRISIPDGHVDEIVKLADSRSNDAVDYVFGGITLEGRPLVRARVFTGNLYSLDLK